MICYTYTHYYHTWTRRLIWNENRSKHILSHILSRLSHFSLLIYCTLFPFKIWNMNFEIGSKNGIIIVYTHSWTYRKRFAEPDAKLYQHVDERMRDIFIQMRNFFFLSLCSFYLCSCSWGKRVLERYSEIISCSLLITKQNMTYFKYPQKRCKFHTLPKRRKSFSPRIIEINKSMSNTQIETFPPEKSFCSNARKRQNSEIITCEIV